MFRRFIVMLGCCYLATTFYCVLGAGKTRDLNEQIDRLVAAAATGNQKTIDDLLDMGVDVNQKHEHGYTALHAARVHGHSDLVEHLIKRGADENIKPPAWQSIVDKWIEGLLPEPSPGVVVLVAQDGEIVHEAGFGFASLAHDVPATAQTKFRIGSVTKQFTAAAILKLQEEGQLSVDDTLDKYFPDFPKGERVTLHHLLTHTSGIRSYTDKPEFLSRVRSPIDADTLIASFRDDPYDFEPGTAWKYNNSGYFLLGRIIEKVSGNRYGEYLSETFFDRLNMSNTGVHEGSEVLKNEATGYAWERDKLVKALDWNMTHAGGAGALYSTTRDLYHWNEALFGGKVLSQMALEMAVQVAEVSKSGGMPYGYGWVISEQRGLKTIGHGGGLHGFVSHLVRYPDYDLTIVALVNASEPPPGLNPGRISSNIAQFILWDEMDPVSAHSIDTSVTEEDLVALVGNYDYGGAVLTVTREANRLFAQMTGQPKYEIFPSSKTEFFWKVVDAQVTFEFDDNNKVTRVLHRQNGAKIKAPRMKARKAVHIDPKLLDDYVGKYDYGGRVAVLTVVREGDRLFAQMTGQPKFEIFPKSDDEFFWKVVNAEVKFVKDDDGRVIKAVHQQGGRTIEAPKFER